MNMSNILKRRYKDYKTVPSSSSVLIDDKTFLGLEIEVERCSILLGSYDFWTVVKDGSLRPRDGGKEFVFNVETFFGPDFREPLRGADLVKAINEFTNLMSVTPHSFSKRTGLHVHLNILDMDEVDFFNLIYLYVIVEYVLFDYCGVYRSESAYSKPFGDSDQALELLDILEKDWQQSNYFFTKFTKRSALNIKSVGVKSTIEFRMHKSTTNSLEIIRWLNIILSLKKYAEKIEDISTLLTKISTDKTENLLTEIFGGELSIFLYTQNSRSSLYKGVRNFQQLWVPTCTTFNNMLTKRKTKLEVDL